MLDFPDKVKVTKIKRRKATFKSDKIEVYAVNTIYTV